jgi:hypothetical protein
MTDWPARTLVLDSSALSSAWAQVLERAASTADKAATRHADGHSKPDANLDFGLGCKFDPGLAVRLED